MSIYKNGKLIAGGRQCMPLLSFMWSDHQLNDISWLRADTFSWQSGAMYRAAYAHLADDIDGKTLQSETVGGVTVQFYLADDGHKICPDSEESNVAAIYTATGVAWYYIIDTTNQRFKLPRENPDNRLIKEISSSPVVFEDTNNQVRLAYGRRSETFDLYLGIGSVPGGYNALWYRSGQHDPTQGTYDSAPAPAFHTIKTNISYNTFYQGEQYLYFYVGNFTQTALENTAGLNAEMFNDKVDVGHQVIDFQEPTASNNYTWYRKYADGWIEQGGETNIEASTQTVNLPVEMSNTSYAVLITMQYDSTNALYSRNIGTRTTVSFTAQCNNTRRFVWRVSGMAA